MAKSKEQLARAERLRATMRKHGTALVEQVAAGAPLVDVLDALGLARDLAPDLAERSELRAAQARRRGVLRAQLADPDRGRRDAAQYELETLHGWRRPGTTTVEQRLAPVLARFAEACPDGYRVLYDMLVNAGEISAPSGKSRARRVAS